MNLSPGGTSSRESIAKSIYMKIKYTDRIDFQDPDYLLIHEELKKIPEERIGEFYRELLTPPLSSEPRKPANPTLGAFLYAVKEFRQRLENEIWEEMEVGKRARALHAKILSTIEAMGLADAKGETFSSKAKKVDRRLLKEISFMATKNEKEIKTRLFSDVEIETIERLGGFYNLSRRLLDPSYSDWQNIEELEKKLKEVIVDLEILKVGTDPRIENKNDTEKKKKVTKLLKMGVKSIE